MIIEYAHDRGIENKGSIDDHRKLYTYMLYFPLALAVLAGFEAPIPITFAIGVGVLLFMAWKLKGRTTEKGWLGHSKGQVKTLIVSIPLMVALYFVIQGLFIFGWFGSFYNAFYVPTFKSFWAYEYSLSGVGYYLYLIPAFYISFRAYVGRMILDYESDIIN